MFVRETVTRNKKTGAEYKTCRLVEAIRTEKGPRQRVILHLGELDLSKVQRKKLARIFEGRLQGQTSVFDDDHALAKIADDALANMEFRRLDARTPPAKQEGRFQNIDLDSVDRIHERSAGAEIVAHFAWKKLGLDNIMRDLELSNVEQSLAAATILARLVHPGSERRTRAWLLESSAIPELLGIETCAIGKNAFYEIADTLLAHKTEIERRLRATEDRLFPSARTVFLYDLTNTYFEGAAKANKLAKRGISKEKRTDCPLVTLALVVDAHGFPVFSQVYPGNQAEPETLAHILDRLETDAAGQATFVRPTVVMDKGIATAANIASLRDRGFPYVVVERRRAEHDFEREFADRAEFETFPTVSGNIHLRRIESVDTTRVLVISDGRVEKERAMDGLKADRFRDDVARLARSVERGNIVETAKVERRIGRILQRYPSMSPYFDVAAEPCPDAPGRLLHVSLRTKKTARREEALLGCYVVETSLRDLPAKEIWDLYTTLTRVEAAFRHLKSDLGIHPVRHQNERRTRGHLFISVLAYHLLATIETLLHQVGDHRSWDSIREAMLSVQRGTVVMTDDQNRVHHIRTTSVLEPRQKRIFDSLGIRSPFGRIHKVFNLRL